MTQLYYYFGEQQKLMLCRAKIEKKATIDNSSASVLIPTYYFATVCMIERGAAGGRAVLLLVL